MNIIPTFPNDWRENPTMSKFPLKSIQLITKSNPNFTNYTKKSLFPQSYSFNQSPSPNFKNTHFNPNPNFQIGDFRNLDSKESGIEPGSSNLLEIYKRFDLSPPQAIWVFNWDENQIAGYSFVQNFKLMVNLLSKYGELKWVLVILLNKIKKNDGVGFGFDLVKCLVVLIRQFACQGKIISAIRLFEFGCNMNVDLFDDLLSALCKYGHVRVASDCVDRKMCEDLEWVLSIDVCNMLLDGWFRVRNLKNVERVLLRMRRENLVLNGVSYGTLSEGYCRLGFVDKAIELLGEMRRCGVGPNREVYGPIVDALAGAGRLKEALGMLERFLVLESGPTLSTYNSLVKGFCVAGDLVGAGKIIKMMTSRGAIPSPMTYNYFFRYFLKHGEVEEGVKLYRKMIESGYEPDWMTFHLLLKMLCEQENVDLAIQISKEMRLRGLDSDSVTGTMLINLLCKMRKLEEAVAEFEGLIQRGFVPEYITYQTLCDELKKKGLHALAHKLSASTSAVPSLATSANNVEGYQNISPQKRKSIMRRAKAMSDILKTCSDSRELAKHTIVNKITSADKNRI